MLVGRPYMFGLGAYGEAGVESVIDILRVELYSTMALAGCRTIDDIDSTVTIRETPLREVRDMKTFSPIT
ncbi:UNVERIFIED_CONTAM: FMN-dependent dehydrogenase [Williamsia faeni]